MFLNFLFPDSQKKSLILWLVSFDEEATPLLSLVIELIPSHITCARKTLRTNNLLVIIVPEHTCITFERTIPVVSHDRPQVWLVLVSHTVLLCCCLRSRSMVLFGAQQSSLLMPPGMQQHIWPGAMQRRLVVEALWLAFYQHIWLRKISVWLDPRKTNIPCT